MLLTTDISETREEFGERWGDDEHGKSLGRRRKRRGITGRYSYDKIVSALIFRELSTSTL